MIFLKILKKIKEGEAACNTLEAGTGGLEHEEREGERERRDKEIDTHRDKEGEEI